ncbi:MAG: glycine zipper 2TM domain-containing protein [Burkholderiales bacterium]|nr:glycine zipper 2TM domain-containing protein [Burkholderiales bacterium]
MTKRLVLACLVALPFAAAAAPMTNDDVIRMVKGGLSDATVIQAIDAAEPKFDTSPEGLVRLKQSGVSEVVIQRILARQSGTPAAACKDCGTITAIREINKPGQATGVGAVAGAVVGGIVGRELGGRDHRTAGTVVGAVGGGVAGHMIEKKAREGRTWEISVRMDDGTSRVFHQDSHPSWSAGTRVRVVDGALAPL